MDATGCTCPPARHAGPREHEPDCPTRQAIPVLASDPAGSANDLAWRNAEEALDYARDLERLVRHLLLREPQIQKGRPLTRAQEAIWSARREVLLAADEWERTGDEAPLRDALAACTAAMAGRLHEMGEDAEVFLRDLNPRVIEIRVCARCGHDIGFHRLGPSDCTDEFPGGGACDCEGFVFRARPVAPGCPDCGGPLAPDRDTGDLVCGCGYRGEPQ
jgi:hypothetical protein